MAIKTSSSQTLHNWLGVESCLGDADSRSTHFQSPKHDNIASQMCYQGQMNTMGK